MIISDLYQTNIIVNESNSIENYITIKVLDFNDNPIVGVNVEVKCENAVFTQYTVNGNTTEITNENTIVYTGTTGNNGTFRLDYKNTFLGVSHFYANESNATHETNGLKTYMENVNRVWVYYNDKYVFVKVNGTGNNKISVTGTVKTLATIDNPNLRPFQPVSSRTYWGENCMVRVRENGLIIINDVKGNSWNVGVEQLLITYPRKDNGVLRMDDQIEEL